MIELELKSRSASLSSSCSLFLCSHAAVEIRREHFLPPHSYALYSSGGFLLCYRSCPSASDLHLVSSCSRGRIHLMQNVDACEKLGWVQLDGNPTAPCLIKLCGQQGQNTGYEVQEHDQPPRYVPWQLSRQRHLSVPIR